MHLYVLGDFALKGKNNPARLLEHGYKFRESHAS